MKYAVSIAFALCTLLGAASAPAAFITLTDLNAVATFDLATGGAGLSNWTVDGVNQLQQQWFWYRIGNTGPEMPVNSLPLTSAKLSDGNENPGDDRVIAYYSGNGLKISVDHILTGGAPGSGISDIAETIKIKNISASPMDFHFYQYVDLNLAGTPYDSLVQIDNDRHSVHQTEGAYATAEIVDTPAPSHFQADYAANIRAALNNNGPDDLNDQVSAADGDLGWAFQWDVTLAPNQEFLISKDKRIEGVPEPATLALLAIFGAAVLARRCCKRQRP